MADRSPYIGPRPFAIDDRDLFFGRERDAKELYALVVSHPLTLLYSQSGAGKTSLIHAGLLALLRENGQEVLGPVRVVEVATRGAARVADNVFIDRVLAGLRSDLLPTRPAATAWPSDEGPDVIGATASKPVDTDTSLSDEAGPEPGERVPDAAEGVEDAEDQGRTGGVEAREDDEAKEPEGDLARFFRSLPLRAAPELGQAQPPDRLRVLILDQLEEVFLDVRHWDHRRGFFEELAEAIEWDPNLRVLLAIREEYLAELDAYTRLIPERQWARFRLERLRKPAALDAVTKPLEKVEPRRTFDEGVAEELVDALAIEVEMSQGAVRRIRWWPRRRPQPETIPGGLVEPVHLQVVCDKLWKTLRADEKTITREHYKVAHPDPALTDLYEGAVKAASRRTRLVWQWRVRRWVGRKLITPVGTRNPVFRGDRKSGGLSNRAIAILEGEHIVRAERRAGAIWYELTHDRLIQPILDSNSRYWRPRLIVLAALLGVWIGAPIAAALMSGSESGVAPLTPSLDFGQVRIGGIRVDSVALESRSKPLIIRGIETSSETFQASPGCDVPGELPARATCTITVVFAPFTEGKKTAVLRIMREGGPPLNSTLSGIGVSG